MIDDTNMRWIPAIIDLYLKYTYHMWFETAQII